MQGPSTWGLVVTIPNGATTGARITIDGVRGAIFQYDSSGRLVGSDSPSAGTDDGFGNAYVAGKATYSFHTLPFFPVLVSSINNGAFISYSASSRAGPFTLQSSLQQDLTIPNQIDGPNILSFTILQAPVPVLDPVAGGTTAETHHSLGTLTGYTVSRGTYFMTVDGTVFFDIVLAGNGTNALTAVFSNVLPAPYIPATTKIVPMAQTRTVTAGDAFPRLQIGSTGNVTVFAPAININSGLHYQGDISLA